MKRTIYVLLLWTVLGLSACSSPGPIQYEAGAYLVSAADGRVLRIRAYSDSVVRLQTRRPGESFLPDDHYDMVAGHDRPGALHVDDQGDDFEFSTETLRVVVDKTTLRSRFFLKDVVSPVLEESAGVASSGTKIVASFVSDPEEHFTGLGHGYFARAESIDLRGTVVRRNYGREHSEQAPLIVPFFLSNKGYGLFLNSMFPNTFRFSADGAYDMAIDDHGFGGQMDYFFIAGPKLTSVLQHYVELTGRPRLPAKAMFGLQLSDKGHDHNSATPSDEQWWKQKINEHRAAGFPLDHVVNDNRWRAGGGKRCESRLEWDPERYPDPSEYKRWLDEHGLVTTLDFNRCIGQFSAGWQPNFNLPETSKIEFAESAPDLTNDEFRHWFWQVFYDQSLNPALEYPGDALWIDEFDEMGAAPGDMILANGRRWAEMRNYWFFLIAKALVGEGWDRSDIERRPFVWVRGMTAGAQRYATLWSGDIKPNYKDMAAQIRSMQLAGLSGFPFWSHDAGGFYDYDAQAGPDDAMYLQWSMAFGSFAPIWRPHGIGRSRWPADRPVVVQDTARRYARLRYELMPYTYTAAHEAAATGLPIARPMLLAYQDEPAAWEHDLQYLWGADLLVAPNPADHGSVGVWLPEGHWYELEQGRAVSGGKNITVEAGTGFLPVYVRAGAIIPRREFALSTAFIDKRKLLLDVYAGEDGAYQLIEDDDSTEAYRQRDERMTTRIEFDDSERRVVVHPAVGSYNGAPVSRSYEIRVFGVQSVRSVLVNGRSSSFRQLEQQVIVEVAEIPVTRQVVVDIVDRAL